MWLAGDWLVLVVGVAGPREPHAPEICRLPAGELKWYFTCKGDMERFGKPSKHPVGCLALKSRAIHQESMFTRLCGQTPCECAGALTEPCSQSCFIYLPPKQHFKPPIIHLGDIETAKTRMPLSALHSLSKCIGAIVGELRLGMELTVWCCLVDDDLVTGSRAVPEVTVLTYHLPRVHRKTLVGLDQRCQHRIA